MKTLIIGGVAGGASAAARLRRLRAVSYTHLYLGFAGRYESHQREIMQICS